MVGVDVLGPEVAMVEAVVLERGASGDDLVDGLPEDGLLDALVVLVDVGEVDVARVDPVGTDPIRCRDAPFLLHAGVHEQLAGEVVVLKGLPLLVEQVVVLVVVGHVDALALSRRTFLKY